MRIEDIKWLHVESSSKCNAWCPACPRNKHGYGISEGLVEQDLDAEIFKEHLSKLNKLTAIQFCGNFGDPIAGHNFLELVSIAKRHTNKIQIHTNGSLRSETWWLELANLLSDIEHDVWFGIDGLSGVHEIYRQGTDYNKIIKNATAFVNNGGYATWQFIPYDHNEHQLKDCIRESQRLGFKKFKLAKLYRIQQPARNYKTGEEYQLLPPKEFQHLLQIMQQPNSSIQVKIENCMHNSIPSIYLDASGKLSYCCFLANTKNPEKFDSIQELLYNTVDLTRHDCLLTCGT
jgi:sulfatase maturation enzyme AslB (radical SAM superfamily)